MKKISVIYNVNIRLLLMVALIVQPVGAMDNEPSSSGLWSMVKSHPVLTATTVAAYAVTAAGLGFFGSELWTARQNRTNQDRCTKLVNIVSHSKNTEEIKKALAEVQSTTWLKCTLQNRLFERVCAAIRNGNKDEVALCVESSDDPKEIYENHFTRGNLAFALEKDQQEIIQLLSEKHVISADMIVDAGPLLVRAAALGAVKTVAWLLDSKADPNVRSPHERTALHEAVIHGRKDIIPVLVAGGVDVNGVDKDKKSALDYAWRTIAHVGIIMPILECERLVFDAEKYGYLLPLMAAVGDIKAVQWLLEHGVQANVVCDIDPYRGFTAMHCAARSGNTELLSLLLDNNPQFAVVLDRKVPTPLMLAAGNGHVSAAMQLLLEHAGSFPTEVDAEGKDALCHAAGNGQYFVVRLLHAYQTHRFVADKNAPKPSAVHAAINGGHYEIAAYLIDQGCPLTMKDREGDTPLHSLIKKPYDEGFMRYVLERSTSQNINMLNNARQTPLDVAHAHKHGKAIEMLVRAGALRADELVTDMEQHNPQPQEQTADKAQLDKILEHSSDLVWLKDERILINRLLVAVQQDNESEAEKYLARGIQPTNDALRDAIDNDKKGIIALFSRYGVTALTQVDSQPVLLRAFNKQAENIVTYLLKNGREDILPVLERSDFNFAEHTETLQQALHDLAKAGQVNAIRWLINNGIDADARDSEKYPLIHRAAEGGHTNVIQLCVERRKSDVRLIGPNNVTPIMLAAGSGSVDAVQFLWDNDGFHPGAADDNYMTPLAHAAAKGHLEVAQRLVLLMKDLMKTCPCSLDGSHFNKATPVHHAIYNEQYKVAQYLLEQGADATCIDASGDSLLFAAVKKTFDGDFMSYLIGLFDPKAFNEPNQAGYTVSAVALQYGNKQAYDMLIEAGAKTTKKLKEEKDAQ